MINENEELKKLCEAIGNLYDLATNDMKYDIGTDEEFSYIQISTKNIGVFIEAITGLENFIKGK